jgi:1-acyl-sn-glycerol-3-phosphate acyltransferase
VIAVCRFLFFFVVMRPIVLIVLGLNVRRRDLLPRSGPAVLIANHNSHLDTIAILSLFPWRVAQRIRPVAASDYFLRNRALTWFSLNILRILPLSRGEHSIKHDPIAGISTALDAGDVVLLFPEGTRGIAEQLAEFRSGIAHVAKRHPDVPITPIFLHGLGKALPKGEALLVPFFCDVFVGEPFHWTGHKHSFMDEMQRRMQTLKEMCEVPPWE